MNSSVPPDKLAEIQRLIADGRKIDAIKLMREATGLGLKEAKDAVEALADDPNFVVPARSTPSGGLPSNTVSKSGCFGAMLLLGPTIGVVAWVAIRQV